MSMSHLVDREIVKICELKSITAAQTLSTGYIDLVSTDKLQIVCQELGGSVNIPAATITVKFYDGLKSANAIQRGADSSLSMAEVIAGSQQVVEETDERVKEAKWATVSIALLYTAAYTATFYVNKLKSSEAASYVDTATSTLKISQNEPVISTIVDTTYTASGTYSLYHYKKGYGKVEYHPQFGTAAATSLMFYGSVEDVTAGASVSTAGWSNKQDAFGGVSTAGFTDPVHYVDNDGKFGGDTLVRVDFTCSAGQTLKLIAVKWEK